MNPTKTRTCCAGMVDKEVPDRVQKEVKPTGGNEIPIYKAHQPSILDTNVYASNDGLWEHDYAEAAHCIRDHPEAQLGEKFDMLIGSRLSP